MGRRVPQRAVLDLLDAALRDASWWEQARQALLTGREGWQYAAARNRAFRCEPWARPSDLLHCRRPGGGGSDGSGALTERDLGVLLGQREPDPERDSILDLCRSWPGTQIQCFVPKAGAGPRSFPRCPQRDGGAGVNPYWLLGPASVLPVLALDPRPGHSVLDTCASPGGKSFLLAQHHAAAAAELRSNDLHRGEELALALRHHAPGVDVSSTDARALGALGTFDRILVDAPCSTDKHLVLSTSATVERELPRLRSGFYPALQASGSCYFANSATAAPLWPALASKHQPWRRCGLP